MYVELKVRNKSTTQLLAKEAVRTLGVHACPQLQWEEEFKVMKEKMIKSIAKLKNTEIKPYLMCLYFNMCLLKKFFFGSGVIKLLKRQSKELRKLHESAISKKLRLGSNFPRAALHSRKKSFGIGIIKPKKSGSNIFMQTLHRKRESYN